jgi:hypothetical protein
VYTISKYRVFSIKFLFSYVKLSEKTSTERNVLQEPRLQYHSPMRSVQTFKKAIKKAAKSRGVVTSARARRAERGGPPYDF